MNREMQLNIGKTATKFTSKGPYLGFSAIKTIEDKNLIFNPTDCRRLKQS